MPKRAPVFRPAGWRPRQAWQPARRHQHQRIRGRAGVKLRRQVLQEEPLCRKCLEAGMTTASAEVDHIVPLADGGSNERSNLQGLCVPCHEAKTKAETRGVGQIFGTAAPDTDAEDKFSRGRNQR